MKRVNRPDQNSGHKAKFQKNKKALAMDGKPCALCGLPIDYSLQFPDPWSFTADHIIPIAKGGHPSALDNLQPAHLRCNTVKKNKLALTPDDINRLRLEQGCTELVSQARPFSKATGKKIISNDDLPLSMDWTAYRSSE